MLGLGLSIPQVAARGSRSLVAAIRSLFAANEPGVWFDPSDLSTLYQDAEGTTPVTAVEQPVGLILDKSKGLVLGQEYITNAADREFSADTGFWLREGGATISGGVVNINNPSGTSPIYKFNFPNTSGGYVEISFDLVLSAGAVHVLYGPRVSQTFTTSGRVSVRMYRSAVGTFGIRATGGGTAVGTIDNISVRELPGNHAYQTTATSRPVLSARYNLLTKTEQFDDAVWLKADFGLVVANQETSPDGTLSADKLAGVSGNTRTPQTFQNITAVSGQQYTLVLHAKSAEKTTVTLMGGGALSGAGVRVNLSTGSVTATLSQANLVNYFVTQSQNGFWRIEITVTANSTGTGTHLIRVSNDNGSAYLQDGTSGIYIWGASLVLANQASLPYQRVNTATDYDSDPAKFKPYLLFDGIDDWLVTNTITPGIDKAQVFAGVRKLRGDRVEAICELSADTNNNNGAVSLFWDWSVGWRVSSKGTLRSNADLYEGGPLTRVLTGLGDISGDSSILRINATQVASNTADQGTGNYLAYPLYIGRRGGTTLPFNGHLYSLIVRFGSNLPAATIEKTEKYINTKTRAY